MPLLRILILLPLVLATACISGGPLTPEDSFYDLRKSFVSGDVILLKKILSTESLKKFEGVLAGLRTLNDDQVGAFSAQYGIAPEKVRSLTMDDFCAFYLAAQKETALGRALRSRIVAREQRGDRVTITVEAGAELHFVKEGPYWKADLTGL